jgi:hypothetical protein
MQQVGQNAILQEDAAPLRVVYTRLDHLEKEITALKRLVMRYTAAPKTMAVSLGGLAKGSVVNEEDFAEAKAWVLNKKEESCLNWSLIRTL